MRSSAEVIHPQQEQVLTWRGPISLVTHTVARVVFKTLDRRRKRIDEGCANVAPALASS